MQEMLEREAEKLVKKAVELAMAGNIGALRLCLDRLVPAPGNEPLVCEMPPLAKTADAVAAIAGIASAAVAGDISADEAAKLAKVVSLYINTLEAHDFEDRLAQLERADHARAEAVRKEPPICNDAGAPTMSRKADA
jgi:hypothetical protein